jgi:hypothetical protein
VKLAGSGGLTARAVKVDARKTKHGRRPRWGQHEWAQIAIDELFPAGVPKDIKRPLLVTKVRIRLAKTRQYCAADFPRISRNTILRAAGLLTT